LPVGHCSLFLSLIHAHIDNISCNVHDAQHEKFSAIHVTVISLAPAYKRVLVEGPCVQKHLT